MPSYAPDPDLLLSLRHYVAELHDGVVKRAATTLGVDYIMLRRFLVAGRAKPENRQRLRSALNAKSWGVAKDHKITHDVPIDMTRSLLSQLLKALDAYEAAASAAPDKGGWRRD